MPRNDKSREFLSNLRLGTLFCMALIAIPHGIIVIGALSWISQHGLPGEPGRSALLVCWAAGIIMLDLALFAAWLLIPSRREGLLWLVPLAMLVGTVLALFFGQFLRPVLFAIA